MSFYKRYGEQANRGRRFFSSLLATIVRLRQVVLHASQLRGQMLMSCTSTSGYPADIHTLGAYYSIYLTTCHARSQAESDPLNTPRYAPQLHSGALQKAR
jgi:hypothetical protein